MEKIFHEKILHFLPKTRKKIHILLISAAEILPELVKRLPNAKISVVEKDSELFREMQSKKNGIILYAADFTKERLPFSDESFDYIIADRCLEQMENPQDFAMAMFLWLKEVGYLIAGFTNACCQGLRQNDSSQNYGRLFCLSEIKQLLFLSFYKELIFAAIEAVMKQSDFVEKQVRKDCNEDELFVAVWVVKASRSTTKAGLLKGYFTRKIRQEMACRLRRIAYDIDRDENCSRLWCLCDKQKIPLFYVAAFIENTAVEPLKLMAVLGSWAKRHGRMQAGLDLLAAGRKPSESVWQCFGDDKQDG
jgi:hypothetical protein